MCGIVGVAGRAAGKQRAWLDAARDLLRHRGPDGAGTWWSSSGRAGLAHRRLAIVDTSAAGDQPMESAGAGLCIVFNGEIYNFTDLRSELSSRGHVFRSHSDTEVLLASYREWGTGCLSRLNGAFAFALFDEPRGCLFLARDRAGEKPLFYSEKDGDLVFASELKGLFANPGQSRNIDPEALDCYLAVGFVPESRCIVQGVRKLPPAHALLFDVATSRSQTWRYWQLPEREDGPGDPSDVLVEGLEELLEDAVRRQLAADVPVGVLLSGGVDSSLITAMAVRAVNKVKTFTVRFPGHSAHDETEHARRVARHFGTEHVELEASDCTPAILPSLARQFDEPVVDSSMVPTSLLARLVREHCTVALGGDGGDELFGGYAHYRRLLRVRNIFGWIPRRVRSLAAASAESVLPVGFKGRNWIQSAGVDYDDGLPLVASYFDARSRGRLQGMHGPGLPAAERIWRERTPANPDLLQRATRMDFENYLPEDILVKIDRAGMMHSLEVRAPMLDYRLIEFAFAKVPSALKATPDQLKILPHRLAARCLPAGFEHNRKQGFSIPLASWLETPVWNAFFRDVLFSAGSGFLDRQAVESLWEGQKKGRSNSERLFALVMLELWRKEYSVSGP